jgi:hypothetical protein
MHGSILSASLNASLVRRVGAQRSDQTPPPRFIYKIVEDSMPIRIVIVLAIASFLFADVAFAGPKEDVAAATAKWGETLGQNDPDKVLTLYATDAVLWGTLSPTVRGDRAALRDYFVGAFKVLPGLKVSFGEQLICVYGTTAVNTGYYTFPTPKMGSPRRFRLDTVSCL